MVSVLVGVRLMVEIPPPITVQLVQGLLEVREIGLEEQCGNFIIT